MQAEADLMHRGLKTPRAAAVAGIMFSLLLMTSMMLIRVSIPPDPMAGAAEVVKYSDRIAIAFDLLPFAGICFLWFVGVIRDRLGKLEDRFFATVFFGSALLFLATIFIAGAVAGAIVKLLYTGPDNVLRSGGYTLSRLEIYQTMHYYVIKMAGVFMISTSTISLRTRIVPRWLAVLGFGFALALLISFGTFQWILFVFPLWVLLISAHILFQNYWGVAAAD